MLILSFFYFLRPNAALIDELSKASLQERNR